MACGCNKTKPRNVYARKPNYKRPKSSSQVVQSTSTQKSVESLSVKAPSKSPSGMHGERRRIEKLRRDAVRKALNKS